MAQNTLNVADVATQDKRYIFTDIEGRKVTAELFVMTHPKTNEKLVQCIFSDNNFYVTADNALELSHGINELGVTALRYNIGEGAISITKDTFRKLLNEKVFKRVIFEYVGDHEGTEYKKFTITPEFKTLLKPIGERDYFFVDYLLISPFYDEFVKQMEFYGGLDMIEFKNFNYEEYKSYVISKYNEPKEETK